MVKTQQCNPTAEQQTRVLGVGRKKKLCPAKNGERPNSRAGDREGGTWVDACVRLCSSAVVRFCAACACTVVLATDGEEGDQIRLQTSKKSPVSQKFCLAKGWLDVGLLD
jgi:hypothetical protein